MPLDKYPFSERYGWIEDKYGVSWQIIFTKESFTQNIIPAFLFTQDLCGKAKEAVENYVRIFPESKIDMILKYGKNEFNEKKENIMYSKFTLAGEYFIAMDSGMNHAFKFNEAISLIVNCKDQKEIDYYWGKLSAVPESEQCGWLKDMYGVSWQIAPKEMNEMMDKGTPEQIARVTQAFLLMKKFDVAKLTQAYEGK